MLQRQYPHACQTHMKPTNAARLTKLCQTFENFILRCAGRLRGFRIIHLLTRVGCFYAEIVDACLCVLERTKGFRGKFEQHCTQRTCSLFSAFFIFLVKATLFDFSSSCSLTWRQSGEQDSTTHNIVTVPWLPGPFGSVSVPRQRPFRLPLSLRLFC